MAFKFKDLIVTIDQCRATQPILGCGTTPNTRTLGPGAGAAARCGSSATLQVKCLDSAEVLTLTPYSGISPHYQKELRDLLLYALASSKVKVPVPQQLGVLTEQMTPRSLEDIQGLERRFKAALKELGRLKRELRPTKRRRRKR